MFLVHLMSDQTGTKTINANKLGNSVSFEFKPDSFLGGFMFILIIIYPRSSSLSVLVNFVKRKKKEEFNKSFKLR